MRRRFPDYGVSRHFPIPKTYGTGSHAKHENNAKGNGLSIQ
jgi:hypothetical protein